MVRTVVFLEGGDRCGRNYEPTIQQGLNVVSTHDELGTDKDDRGLGIREERELDSRTADYLGEENEATVFSEAAMPNAKVGT